MARKKPLQRNALIALANLGDTSALPEIESCLSDVRPVIRATAAWSIGRLGRKEPEKWLETLEQMKQREEDQEVITEIIEAQEMLAKKTKRKKEDMKEAVSSERIRENFMYKIPFTSIIRKE